MWSVQILFIFTVSSCACASEGVYYVTPKEDISCPGEPCHTLLTYAEDNTFSDISNTVFRFLPGDHVMNGTSNVMCSGFNLSWIGDSEFLSDNNTFLDIHEPSSRILCKDTVGFTFKNIHELLIMNLVFSNCTSARANNNNTSYSLSFSTIHDLSIYGIMVNNSSGYGLWAKNILGYSVIHSSTFMFNGNSIDYGGNIFIEYTVDCSASELYTLNITSSNILFGRQALNVGLSTPAAAGLTLMFTQSCYDIEVFIENVVLYGNVALSQDYGGNMFLCLSGSASTSVFIENSSFSSGEAEEGGGLKMRIQDCNGGIINGKKSIVHLSNTVFIGNSAMWGGGMGIELQGLRGCTDTLVVYIKDTNFSSNRAEETGGHVGILYDLTSVHNFTVLVNGSYFVHGAATKGGALHITTISHSSPNVMTVERMPLLEIVESYIVNNTAEYAGGGLHIDSEQYLHDSEILVRNVTFTNNSGVFGGALSLQQRKHGCQPLQEYHQNVINVSNTAFVSNSAISGGGVELFLSDNCTNNTVYITNSFFSKNTAKGYGGHIDLNYTFDPRYTYSSTIVRDCYFEYGRAENGGGIHVLLYNGSSAPAVASDNIIQAPAPLLQIIDSCLVSNSAQKDGGGGMVDFASIHHHYHIFFDKVNFTSNSALHGGNIFIRDSYSAGRNYVTINRSNVELGSARLGGGMMIHTLSFPCSELVSAATCKLSTLTITNTVFQHNTAHCHGGGLGIALNHSCCAVLIHIHNTTFLNNSVGNCTMDCADVEDTEIDFQGPPTGGNVAIEEGGSLFSTNSITMEDSVIKSGSAEKTGGLFVKHIPWISTKYTNSCIREEQDETEFLLINNTSFLDNMSKAKEGTAFEVAMNLSKLYPHLQPSNVRTVMRSVRVENCVIYGMYSGISNVRALGAEPTQNLPLLYSVMFVNTSFSGYQEPGLHRLQTLMTGMRLVYVHNATFIDCEFLESGTVGAIRAIGSKLYFQGNITFRGNTGTDGGALSLYARSVMFLKNRTYVTFMHNHATHFGGALYVEHSVSITRQCFCQIDTILDVHLTQSIIADLDLHVEFANNTAGYAGSALYGGDIDNCILFNDTSNNTYNYFDEIFTGQDNSEDTTAISSDPRRVCFCVNNRPECHTRVLHTRVLPGASFNISAAVVGQKDGTVPADVHTQLTGNSTATFHRFQDTQAVRNSCTILTYTLFSSNSLEVFINLTPAWIPPTTESSLVPYPPYASVNITVLPCPPGFAISQTPTKCDCLPKLSKRVTCDITTQTITPPPSMWLGYSPTSGVILHNNCPFDYCKSETIPLQLNDTDVQCAFSRSGILCGACKPGLSLALGSSRCLECSNRYEALLIAFIATGIALVFLISVLDLTVTEGTVNGLIFYANILHVNRAIFFPGGESNILTVFIAWISLDLGIETCFYDGMDTYVKTWLQFVFPVYIWLIVGIIIIISDHSLNVAGLFHGNAVKVLATIILLSFAKLQRTLIIGLSFTYLEYLDKGDEAVWLYDGNIKYLHGKSILLFMASILVLLTFVVPCTIVILFIQCLQLKTEYHVLAWVRRLKPFFDAYTGPYKDKYRFWTGLLLLTRTVLFLIFALNVLGEPTLNLLVITIVSTCFLALSPDVYKKKTLTLLERSFFVNLSVTSTATLYTMFTEGDVTVVANISIGIAFVTFIGIFLYHSWKCITNSNLRKSLTKWLHRKPGESHMTDIELDNLIATDDSSGEKQNNDTHPIVRPLVLVFRGTGEHREAVLIHEDSDSEEPQLPQ